MLHNVIEVTPNLICINRHFVHSVEFFCLCLSLRSYVLLDFSQLKHFMMY